MNGNYLPEPSSRTTNPERAALSPARPLWADADSAPRCGPRALSAFGQALQLQSAYLPISDDCASAVDSPVDAAFAVRFTSRFMGRRRSHGCPFSEARRLAHFLSHG